MIKDLRIELLQVFAITDWPTSKNGNHALVFDLRNSQSDINRKKLQYLE